MLRESLQRWVASAVTGTVTLRLRRGDDRAKRHREDKWTVGSDRRSPPDHAAGLPRLEDHRNLLERAGVTDAAEEEDA